jgi:hypothetical protein
MALFFSACNQTGTEQKPGKKPAETLCFGSVSPNAFKATPLYDYLKLSMYTDGSVEGMGAGFVMQGDMQWITNIKGTLTGDTLKLKVTYEVENADYDGYRGPFTSSETWYFGNDKKHLWRKDCIGLKNWLGEKENHRIDSTQIPADCTTRMKKISLR